MSMTDEKHEDVEQRPCKFCGRDPYANQHVPGQGKTHEYEPREPVKCPSCGSEGHCECY